jgi:hypothetical protein
MPPFRLRPPRVAVAQRFTPLPYHHEWVSSKDLCFHFVSSLAPSLHRSAFCSSLRPPLDSPLSTTSHHSPSLSKPEESSPTSSSTPSTPSKPEPTATTPARASSSATVHDRKAHRRQPPPVPLWPHHHTVGLHPGLVILYGSIFLIRDPVFALPTGVPLPPPCATVACLLR